MRSLLGMHIYRTDLIRSMCQGQVLPSRQPTGTPPFTIGTLRKAIPPHCFDRSLLRSSAYLGADLAAVALLYFCSTLFSHPAVPALVRWGLLWPTYWVLQGAVCTGLWVIAHECGHQVCESFQHQQCVPFLHACMSRRNLFTSLLQCTSSLCDRLSQSTRP